MNLIFSVFSLSCFLPTLVTAADGNIIVAGGLNKDGFYGYVNELDTLSGEWTEIGDLPGDNGYGLAETTFNGTAYAIAGHPTGRQVLFYDPKLNMWQNGTSLPKSKGQGASAFSIGDTLYVVGGADDPKGLEMLSTSVPVWKSGASSMNPHNYSSGTVLDKTFYICGTTSLNASTLCETYDPASDKWTASQPMLQPRHGFGLVTLGKYIYALGGAEGKNERFDPVKKEWTYIQAMLTPRYDHAVASDGQYLYALGGRKLDGTVLDSVEIYIPAFDIWQRSTDIYYALRLISAAFVPKE